MSGPTPFRRLDARIDAHCDAREHAQALALIEEGLQRFPDRRVELENNRIFCHRAAGELERCLDLLEEGVSRGRFYGLRWKSWDGLRALPGYPALERRNDAQRDRAQIEARPRCQVIAPPGPSVKRPVALVLHGDGNGCNLEAMIEAWPAEPYLERGFLVAYLQSSRVECTNGYGWTRDYGRSRSEIHGLLQQVAESHRIDETCILAGGFSGGAMASIDLLCEGVFPLKGVIALCPARTGSERPEAIARAAQEGTRVVLLEGERSGPVHDQEELMAQFREAGLSHVFLANAGIGHAIPLDIEGKLEEALDFILSRED